MTEYSGEIIVGVLGQWASGKSTAACMLVTHLGGEDEVVFITDRELFAGQVTNHFLELEDTKVTVAIEEDGSRRLESECATVWLAPGEDLKTVDLNMLRFDLPDELLPLWLNRAREVLAAQICERSACGKPIVIEAGFGKIPFDHTLSDFFNCLGDAGVGPDCAKWIIVEAGFAIRSERNEKRRDKVPIDVFAQYAADGGGLDPECQHRLQVRGTKVKRVPNDHDDIDRFRADIIAAFEEMFEEELVQRA
jgi:hypothetical protein